MRESWRVWYGVRESSVCGWDPDTDVSLWALIACVVGIGLSYAFQWWLLLLSFIILGIGVVTGPRYRLAVTHDGYRLTRYCCWWIPWFSRQFDAHAIITIEDDWGVGIGVKIHASHETFEQGVVFGTGEDCEKVARRIRALANIHHGIER